MKSSGSNHDDLGRLYAERQSLYETLSENLEEEVRRDLSGLDHIDRIEFRVKSQDSFLDKCFDPNLIEPYDEPLVDVEDQIGGRVIVFFLDDISVVAERIQEIFNTVERERHRPEKDQAFGYESEHRICSIPPHCEPDGWGELELSPNTFELQIRTIFMHAYAEPQHNFAYKAADELEGPTRRELAWIAASAWGADKAFQRVFKRRSRTNSDEPPRPGS